MAECDATGCCVGGVWWGVWLRAICVGLGVCFVAHQGPDPKFGAPFLGANDMVGVDGGCGAECRGAEFEKVTAISATRVLGRRGLKICRDQRRRDRFSISLLASARRRQASELG